MQKAIIVKGRMINPTTVELDEPLSEVTGGVELVLPILPQDQTNEGETVFVFLRRLPPGTRTKEDTDRQIREVRNSWGNR